MPRYLPELAWAREKEEKEEGGKGKKKRGKKGGGRKKVLVTFGQSLLGSPNRYLALELLLPLI